MSKQIYKTLRQYSKYTETSYKKLKHAWDKSSKEEQEEVLPSIKRVIEEAKKHNVELDKKEKEEHDKKANNK